jgi:hypothetical protein
MGVLCATTTGAAALGITMHPQPARDVTPTHLASQVDMARLNALLRADRGYDRATQPAPTVKPTPKPTPTATAKPAPKPAPKPTPTVAPTPPKPKVNPLTAPLPHISGLNASQVKNAWAVVLEGHKEAISQRGQIIAIATTLQESYLVNQMHATDHDSLGIFQQRPSMGWGTRAQITNPTYASRKFYSVLVQYKRLWSCLTCAAQKVQRSAYPNAYAKWEKMATRIVATLNRRFV